MRTRYQQTSYIPVQQPRGTKRAILWKISQLEEISGFSVSVIYRQPGDRDKGIAEFCKDQDLWRLVGHAGM